MIIDVIQGGLNMETDYNMDCCITKDRDWFRYLTSYHSNCLACEDTDFMYGVSLSRGFFTEWRIDIIKMRSSTHSVMAANVNYPNMLIE